MKALCSRDEMIRIGGFNAYHNLLDIGCGDCRDLLAVEETYGIRMFGFDRDVEAIRAAQAQRPYLRIKDADAEEQNYPDRTFDGILMKQVFSEINNQMEALYLTACALREDGLLFLADYYIRTEDPEEIEAARRLAEAADQDAIENGNCETRKLKRPSRYCVGRAFTRAGLQELIDKAGLELVERVEASDWEEAGALGAHEGYFFAVLRRGASK